MEEWIDTIKKALSLDNEEGKGYHDNQVTCLMTTPTLLATLIKPGKGQESVVYYDQSYYNILKAQLIKIIH